MVSVESEISDLPEFEGVSIVLVGAVNPAICHPIWFQNQGLIPEKMASDASQNAIVSREVAQWQSGWLSVQVLQNLFQARCDVPPSYEALRDFACGTFEVLRHTPISKMGLNIHAHFKLPSEEIWHRCGHRLVPKAIWSKVLDTPGMNSVAIKESRADGHVLITAQPSVKFPRRGLFLNINDETILPASVEEPAAKAAEIVQKKWAAFIQDATKKMKILLRESTAEEKNA